MSDTSVRSGAQRRRFHVLAAFACALCGTAAAQTAVPLWPGGAPGAKGATDADKPTITAFPASKPNGAAMVIFPGGGYEFLATEHEGNRPAAWFNAVGVSCFVVKYRLGPAYHHPIEMWDGQRAIRWVRAHARQYGIDTARVGVMGFSAGGHLAATVSTHYDSGNPSAPDSVDRHPCRPAWSILGYPVITMDASFTHAGSRKNLLGDSPSRQLVDSLSNEKQVTSRTPPAFLFHAKDDNVVPVRNPQAYFDSLIRHGVEGVLKLYDKGGHGFGLADGQGGAPDDPILATWPGLAGDWMEKMGFFRETVALSGWESGSPHPGAVPDRTPIRTRATGLMFRTTADGCSDASGRRCAVVR